MILLLGAALRLGVVLASPGGFGGNFGYDPGVYYAGADALTFGRRPYSDFVLLHPPGIALALAPFAVLGRLTDSDRTGFLAANLSFALLGALNAVLVLLIARRLGCPRIGALLGGAFYAIWYGAVNAEVGVRLEPLGAACFLGGVLVLAGQEKLSGRRALLAGAFFALACSVKIWWGGPLLAVLVGLLWRRGGRRPAAYFAAGAALAALVVDGPFFLAAPRSMARMVFRDQLGRAGGRTLSQSLDNLTAMGAAFPDLTGPGHVFLLTAFLAVVAAVVAAAWRRPPARLIVALFTAQLVVLALTPLYFADYADYAAGTLAVLVGAAYSGRALRIPWLGAVIAGGAVLVVTAMTAVTVFVRPNRVTAPFPSSRLAAAVAHLRCVTSDSPLALIRLEALSRSLADGCPMYVDLTGLILDLHVPAESGLPMVDQPTWQARARAYLFSGDAVILVRATGRLRPDLIGEIVRHPKLAQQAWYRVYDLRVPIRH